MEVPLVPPRGAAEEARRPGATPELREAHPALVAEAHPALVAEAHPALVAEAHPASEASPRVEAVARRVERVDRSKPGGRRV